MSKLHKQDSAKSKVHGSYFAKSQIVRRLDSGSPTKKPPCRADRPQVITQEKTVQKIDLDDQSSKFMTYLKQIGIAHHFQHQQDLLRAMTENKATGGGKFLVNCMLQFLTSMEDNMILVLCENIVGAWQKSVAAEAEETQMSSPAYGMQQVSQVAPSHLNLDQSLDSSGVKGATSPRKTREQRLKNGMVSPLKPAPRPPLKQESQDLLEVPSMTKAQSHLVEPTNNQEHDQLRQPTAIHEPAILETADPEPEASNEETKEKVQNFNETEKDKMERIRSARRKSGIASTNRLYHEQFKKQQRTLELKQKYKDAEQKKLTFAPNLSAKPKSYVKYSPKQERMAISALGSGKSKSPDIKDKKAGFGPKCCNNGSACGFSLKRQSSFGAMGASRLHHAKSQDKLSRIQPPTAMAKSTLSLKKLDLDKAGLYSGVNRSQVIKPAAPQTTKQQAQPKMKMNDHQPELTLQSPFPASPSKVRRRKGDRSPLVRGMTGNSSRLNLTLASQQSIIEEATPRRNMNQYVLNTTAGDDYLDQLLETPVIKANPAVQTDNEAQLDHEELRITLQSSSQTELAKPQGPRSQRRSRTGRNPVQK